MLLANTDVMPLDQSQSQKPSNPLTDPQSPHLLYCNLQLDLLRPSVVPSCCFDRISRLATRNSQLATRQSQIPNNRLHPS